tara:strand:+ start:1766 stop:2821 length:1056 start_codon:yes stop_codon:yes gene_type:complete
LKDIYIKVPARICFFGDHQDYLGLPVIAGTINRFITVYAKVNNNNSFNISMPDIKRKRIINIQNQILNVKQGDYFLSSIDILKKLGFNFHKGYDVVITGDIPVNAGLSSSSALVVAWIRFLIQIQEDSKKISNFQIGKWAHESEALYFDQPGGLMDQYTIAHGGLVFIDTEFAKVEKLPNNLGNLVVAESGIKKETLNVLKKAREYAQNSIKSLLKKHPDFDIKSFKEEDYEKYKNLIPKKYQTYFYSTIFNYIITLKAKNHILLNQINFKFLAELMNEHQFILDNYIKNTPKKMAKMILEANKSGALGSKIVGSGGGGCIVAMVEKKNISKVIETFIKNGAVNAYEVKLI